MTFLLKRLALGLLLIAAASGVLLLSDLQWSAPAGQGGQLGKKWNLHLISYVSVVDSEEAEHGIVEGLKDAGLIEGTDYTLTIRNAQGDMPTLNSLVQAALTDRADLLFTLSTPGLQAAMRQTSDIPIIFTFVADPIVAGAGKSNTDHKPNVTGVYVAGAYAEVIALLRECMPKARKVGTLYVPTEVNTVYHKDQTTAEGRKLGLEVVALPVATATEVPAAARALCTQDLDALCQVGGNLTAASFSTIAQAAQQAKLPVFAFLSAQAKDGASVVAARDYHQAGHDTAQVAVRVMRGESPAAIPFAPIQQTRVIVNLPAARACGLTLPSALLRRADQVIGR